MNEFFIILFVHVIIQQIKQQHLFSDRHLCIVGRGKMLSSNALWSKILKICRGFVFETFTWLLVHCNGSSILKFLIFRNNFLIDSPQGFQSSESYIKKWNDTRPKTEGNFAKCFHLCSCILLERYSLLDQNYIH